ncbi:MAG: ABC transporter permease [Ruminococcaceae bacterium]|nr:ABC transporter permease [Oscillospiraceae bacterium]
MKNILVIFVNSVLRNKLMILLTLAAATVACFIFRIGSSGSDNTAAEEDKITVGLVDYDGEISDNLKNYLEDTLGMRTSENDYDSLSKDLIDRKISAIIEVPVGFYESAARKEIKKLRITTLGDYENAAFIEVYLDTYMQGISVISQAANGDEQMFSEMLNSEKLPNEVISSEANLMVDSREKTTSAYSSAVGFIMMMLSAITLIISKQILDDRQLGTFDRMRCSSMKSPEYILGISLFGVICTTMLNLIFTVFVFVTSEGLAIPFGMAFFTTEMFMLFLVGISIMFGLCIKSQMTLMTVGVGFACIGSMLGGAWFPISENLGAVSGVAKIFPQYWTMNLLRNYHPNSGFEFLPNISVLVLATVLVFLISAVIFTRKKT